MHRFSSADGVSLAYRELGQGRPLMLLHGFTGDGSQWTRPGHAQALAEAGYRVVLPDMRGHGASDRSHDPALYPPDVLTDDALALVEALRLDDYDLGGYSLGARTVLRMLVRGAKPGRAVLAGQGLAVIDCEPSYVSRYRPLLSAMVGGEAFEPGSPDAEQTRRMAEHGDDPQALLHVLDSHVATPAQALSQITTPILVATGDQDPNSAEALAAALPGAHCKRLAGTHSSALTSSELTDAILTFLGPAPTSTRS